MKKCKSGYYYCNTDKKCKPIPRGYRVGYGGYLRKEKDDDDSKTKSNGNGNGNGNGSNGNGNGGNGSGGNGGGGNGGGMGEEITYEAKMTEKEKKKKEEIVMSMKKKKKDFEDRYGEDGKSVMYATATKLAMGEALNSDDKPAIKELIKKLKGSAEAHKQQSKDLEVALNTEGSLHKWFKGSKSKDGKGGWVNVVTGGTCASDEPGEGTPKCVSSSKRASMSKSERLSAARRKKKADPGQQSKSGAAKPTYVSTDSPRKKKKMKKESTELLEMGKRFGSGNRKIDKKTQLKALKKLGDSIPIPKIDTDTDVKTEEAKSLFSTPSLDKLKKIKDYKNNADKVFGRKPIEKAHYEPEGEIISEVKDKKGKGSGSKDACYHKVKSRYSVWPSAYASGALVKCRKVGAANWGNSKKEEFDPTDLSFQSFMEKCGKGYEKKGMKTMFGKRYPNCVKKKVGESMVNWRDEIGYEGKDDVKKLSEDDMKGMSVKSGHKRPTKSGAGMTQKGVEAYRRRNPGSKLKTAVTTKPSKLKKGSKAANRRKSYCARSAGQMKKFPKAAKDPNSRLRQARRRWNC